MEQTTNSAAKPVMDAAQAHDMLTAPTTPEPRSLYRTCSGCWALIAPKDLGGHERFHEALAVLAARVLGASS